MIPAQGAKIPHASWPKNKDLKQKQYCNKFTKDFKNGPHQKNLQKKKKNERSDGKYSRICRTMESVTTIQLCSYNAKAAIDDTKKSARMYCSRTLFYGH